MVTIDHDNMSTVALNVDLSTHKHWQQAGLCNDISIPIFNSDDNTIREATLSPIAFVMRAGTTGASGHYYLVTKNDKGDWNNKDDYTFKENNIELFFNKCSGKTSTILYEIKNSKNSTQNNDLMKYIKQETLN